MPGAQAIRRAQKPGARRSGWLFRGGGSGGTAVAVDTVDAGRPGDRIGRREAAESGGRGEEAVVGEENGTLGIEKAEAPAGEERLAMEARELAGSGISSVMIAPWGEVRSTNGVFIVDEEAARLVMEAFAAHRTDLPVDYEHQSLGGAYASPTGQAPAAGWIRAIRAVRPGEAGGGEPGLYGDVEWTESARARLSAREYRYLSPVVLVRRYDRRVVALHSAALTNKPAIAGIKPIVNRSPAAGGIEAEGALEGLRQALGMSGAPLEAVLVGAAARIASLERDAVQRRAGQRVDEAMRAGKLTPAQRAWATALAADDPEAFEAFVACAPVVVATGRTLPPAGGGEGGDLDRAAAAAAAARAAYRREPLLAAVTSEAAWVAQALREAGLEPVGS